MNNSAVLLFLLQNQAGTDESVCRVYEVGRMRGTDDEDEQVRLSQGAWPQLFKGQLLLTKD